MSVPPVPVLRRRPVLLAAGVVLVSTVVTAGVLTTADAGAGRHSHAVASDGLRHTTIQVATSGCGHGWSHPVAGRQVFDLHNTSGTPAEVHLTDARTGAVYGEVEGLGPGSGPAAVPVTQQELVPPTLAYQKWIGSRTVELARRTDVLRAAVDRGDLAAARAAWLPAHLVYERMGAAYGTFGAADAQINGTTAGLPGGLRDRGFAGFHRR